jgi:hypothetical protein
MEKPYQDPTWQEELDRIAPPGGKLSWLSCYWEPGYDHERVERWMIGQVIPAQSISPVIREFLEGPNPADHGHFETDENGRPRWVTDLPGVTRLQWQFFRDTGNHLKPYWCVQGTHGGHRVQWSFTERRIIEMNGGDPNPPVPGALPYAAPDARTFAELKKRDLMRNYAYAISFMENSAERIEADERRGLEEMRRLYWNMVSDQVGGYADEMAFHLRGHMDDAPRTRVQYDKKLEQLEESFIQQGV